MASSSGTNWDSFVLHGVNPTGKEIGRGAYGRVFEVDCEGTLCAAKEVHSILLQCAQDDKIRDDFLMECHVWSTLRHPYIVQFLGTYISFAWLDHFSFVWVTRHTPTKKEKLVFSRLTMLVVP